MTILLSLVRWIGLPGCAILALLAYYEGVPGLRDIPGVTSVPILREFVAGRVNVAAKSAADDAVKGLVALSELTAAQAEAAELRRQVTRNAALADAARAQATAARAAAEAAQTALEKRIAEDNDPNISRWRQHDLERLRNQ